MTAAAFACAALLLGAAAALAQSPPPLAPLADPGVVPDDDLTLVVATHFVGPAKEGTTARAQFRDARIPLSAFNETDHCVDERALEVAREYFTALGRALGKAGHFYFVPEDEIRKSVSMCERLYRRPPQALAGSATKVIAFGQVVPTADAPALERSMR